MTRDQAIALLLENADEIRAAGVAHVALYGSVARNEAGPESDVDLVVEGPSGRPMTLFSMSRADAVLRRIFHRRVGLTAQQGLDRAAAFKARIAPDLVAVF